MDAPTITIITILLTFSIYLIFLVLGVGGIARNRSAQGIDRKSIK